MCLGANYTLSWQLTVYTHTKETSNSKPSCYDRSATVNAILDTRIREILGSLLSLLQVPSCKVQTTEQLSSLQTNVFEIISMLLEIDKGKDELSNSRNTAWYEQKFWR